MENKDYVVRMVRSYLDNLSKKAIFFKQQNVFDMSMKMICRDIPYGDTLKMFFYDYAIYEMKDAYEPFMSWIRQAYYEDFADAYSVEEFVENCGVYSLQRQVFCSYITTGVCCRTLEVMMNEYEYEEKRIIESIYSSLKYIAKEKTIVMVIGQIHMAPNSVFCFLNRIFDRDDNFRFVFTYGETFLVKEYCKNEWNILMQKAEEEKMILAIDNSDDNQNSDVPDKFNFKEDEIGTYINSLTNMLHLHAFKDAKYYFDNITPHIFRIDSKICDLDKFKLLELLGMVYLGMGNYKDTLLVCEKMVPLFSSDLNIYGEYIYNYFSAKAHLLMAESSLTIKFCNNCRPLAEKLNNELLLMNIDVIETVAECGGLKELFRCNYSYQISEGVLERAKKAGNENFLAYMYIFGYDNDDESVRLIGRGEKEAIYFNKGIEIAKRLGNNNLMLNAYMKNIIRYSDGGFHRYVKLMYEKRMKIIDHDNSVRLAHTYVGLGYNAIVLEEYTKADEYFSNCLNILIENKRAEDIAETLYNMFMNYYVAGSNEKVIECIELVLKVMKLINIQGIRICNTSKMYGMLALAHFKLEQYFDCYYCLDKMELILSYIFSKKGDEKEDFWLEDLFLYYLCKANLYSYENNIEKAKEYFELSNQYLEKFDGVKFYSVAEYAIFKAKFLKKIGSEEERTEVLNDAYEYCMSHEHFVKASQLKAELDNVTYNVDIEYTMKKFPVKEIMDVCLYVGSKEELEKREKDIDFLTLCHDIMVREESDVPDVIKNTMNLIRNSFSFDRMLLIERNESCNHVIFSGGNVNLNSKDMIEIYEFFSDYKVEFMASRLDKNFKRYLKVIKKFGEDDVSTIVGIPIFSGGILVRIFIATIDIHRSFTGNRKLPDKNNLDVIKCAISQLDEAIRRIKNSCMIRIMNSKLEKAAFTDQLTGIYNRMGFDKILGDNIADTGVLLYMDLDYFKKYNDTYGHSVGDVILKGFAAIIRENLNNIGYAIRYGGDEFVAIIPEKDEAFAEKIAGNIQQQLKEDYSIRIVIDGQEITSSVGIAQYESADQTGFEIALKMADQALYYVKDNEKGKIACWSQVNSIC